jgi:hypothetical protein
MDRRARIREYKEAPHPMGVHRMRNTANGRPLVGSSVSLPAMLSRPRFQLELGFHRNRELQMDWNESGPGAIPIRCMSCGFCPRASPASSSMPDAGRGARPWCWRGSRGR